MAQNNRRAMAFEKQAFANIYFGKTVQLRFLEQKSDVKSDTMSDLLNVYLKCFS